MVIGYDLLSVCGMNNNTIIISQWLEQKFDDSDYHSKNNKTSGIIQHSFGSALINPFTPVGFPIDE